MKNHFKDILVVVDMQADFRATENQQFVQNVCDEIKQTKRKRRPIVLIEYRGHGPSLHCINNLLVSYKRSVTVWKDDDDGSDVVYMACQKQGWTTDLFRVGGCNLCFCVHDTVHGLAERSKVEVLLNACECQHRYSETPHSCSREPNRYDFKREAIRLVA